jgi:anti-sigma B factor antagonist
MQITQVQSDNVTILRIQGRIDASAAEPFKEKVLSAIGDKSTRLLLDFGQVDFISSMGLRVLVIAARRVAAVGGKLLFCRLEGPVREVFELAGFSSVAAVFPDQESALASLR